LKAKPRLTVHLQSLLKRFKRFLRWHSKEHQKAFHQKKLASIKIFLYAGWKNCFALLKKNYSFKNIK
jgi:hypothetical protein